VYNNVIMAGKGSQLRKGANLNAYWNNYPFPEKLTTTQWISKLGEKDVDMNSFKDTPPGKRITEDEYLQKVKYYEKVILHNFMSGGGNIVPAPWSAAYQEPKVEEYVLTTSELEQLRDNMNSISFSEFQKIKGK
jgi:hypothetical protein